MNTLKTASMQIYDVTTEPEDGLKNAGYMAVQQAIEKTKASGYRPVTMVDCLNIGGVANMDWIDAVVEGMIKACLDNKISCVGGEMAQLPDCMKDNSLDIIVTVLGTKTEEQGGSKCPSQS